MMRIGISDSRPYGDAHYARLRSFGFDCYDFNMANTDSPLYAYKGEAFEAYFKGQRALADEAGVTVWQVHGPWRYPPLDASEADRAERLAKMQYSMRAAALLGAKYWVVHPIMPCGIHDLKTGEAAQTRALNLDFMARLLQMAKAEGVTVCLENMPFVEFSLSSPADIVSVIREIDDPAFAMCLDTGHANACVDWHSPARTVREYGQYIKVLHVHDNRGKRDEHLIPFYGSIDWKDFSTALRECAFDGVISLECAPSSKLSQDIMADMYALYARIAREI